MKTLIAYCTSHGCTKQTAEELQDFLNGTTDLCNLRKDSIPQLEDYDRIIIGGSIHAGQIQKRVKEFASKNLETLQTKEIGLFICCMYEGEKAWEQIREAYPDELLAHAKATACLGGEFNFEKMNFLEKMIVRKVAHVNKTTSNVDKEAIHKFSKKMDKVFNPFLFLV